MSKTGKAVLLGAAGIGALFALRRAFGKPSFEEPFDWGVPFARPTGKVWPVAGRTPSIAEVPYRTLRGPVVHNDLQGVTSNRYFGASRDGGKRWHAGVDLHCDPGEEIVAMERGKILWKAPGYVGLDAIVIEHDKVAVLYGEVALGSLEAHGLRAGDVVEAGTKIATTAKSSSGSMLHIETWKKDYAPRSFTIVAPPSIPPGLLDPTRYLLTLAERSR